MGWVDFPKVQCFLLVASICELYDYMNFGIRFELQDYMFCGTEEVVIDKAGWNPLC
jgi:hypothetical protein